MDKKKILLIEDDLDTIRVLKYRLEKYDYLITNVYKKEEVLEKLSQQKYDLIILDMKLPILEYGIEIFHQIKKEFDKTPILILSVAADEPPVIDLNADALILKPFEFKNLHTKIKELLK